MGFEIELSDTILVENRAYINLPNGLSVCIDPEGASESELSIIDTIREDMKNRPVTPPQKILLVPLEKRITDLEEFMLNFSGMV